MNENDLSHNWRARNIGPGLLESAALAYDLGEIGLEVKQQVSPRVVSQGL